MGEKVLVCICLSLSVGVSVQFCLIVKMVCSTGQRRLTCERAYCSKADDFVRLLLPNLNKNIRSLFGYTENGNSVALMQGSSFTNNNKMMLE